MPLVLALEPDLRQAGILKRVIRERVHAELVVVDSRDGAVAALERQVPDVILLTALLSPRDEAELVAHLRSLEGADHIQTHTIPQLASSGAEHEPGAQSGGLLGKFRRKKATPEPIAGCDPAAFADEVGSFIERAAEMRRHSAAASLKRAMAVPAPAFAGEVAEPEPETVEVNASSAWADPFAWRKSEPAGERVEAESKQDRQPLVSAAPLAVVAEEAEEEALRNKEIEQERQLEAERARRQAAAAEQERLELEAAAERKRVEAEAVAERERQRLAAEAAEKERKRAAAEAAEKERQRLAAEAAEKERKRLAAEAAEKERQRLAAEAAEKERQRLAAEAAEKERKRLAAEAAEKERKRLAAEAAEKERQRLAAEAAEKERQRLAAEAAEKERKRLAAEAAEKERQRLAAEAAEKERQRLAAEAAEKERKRLAAEAAEKERKRLAAEAAEKERQRVAAEAAEKERQRLAAEAAEKERKRLAAEAAEKERLRIAAEAAEKERQRLAAEAAEKERQRIAAEAAERERERVAAEAADAERERVAAEAARVAEAMARDRKFAEFSDAFSDFRAEDDDHAHSLLRLMPLAIWARREESKASASDDTGSDDLRGLMAGLALPPHVAGVTYARGCRIRRVRVPATAKPSRSRSSRPVILSKRALDEARSANG